jgi:hypothetical protein
VTKKLNKILPNFWKKVAKRFQTSTSKLHLKAKNVYIKPLLKALNTYNKPCLEDPWLGENWLSKQLAKEALVAELHPIWSHWTKAEL